MYDEVESFCLFMGYTRSGHSLVGTILDAHPETAIAHEHPVFEDNAFRYSDRDTLFKELVQTTERHARKGKRGNRRGVPNKTIEGGAHGTFTKLRVIGAKRGQETPPAYGADPQIFDKIAAIAGAPVKLLHVYRNPWDNISSMTRVNEPAAAISRYARRTQIIKQFKADPPVAMHDLALEDLTADPGREIRAMVGFFGLEADEDYIARCAGIVDDEAQPSRFEREWTDEEIAQVVQLKSAIPWLARYPDKPE